MLAPWWSQTRHELPDNGQEVIGIWIASTPYEDPNEDRPELAICLYRHGTWQCWESLEGEWCLCHEPDYWQPYLLSAKQIAEVMREEENR